MMIVFYIKENKGKNMQGPSAVDITNFVIGDELRIKGESWDVTVEIIDADADEGLSFKSITTGEVLIIDINDLHLYKFYPRGEAIKRIQEEKTRGYQPPASNDPEEFSTKYVAPPESELEIDPIEEEFFELYEQYVNMYPVASTEGQVVYEKMLRLAETPELLEALSVAEETRNEAIKEHAKSFRTSDD